MARKAFALWIKPSQVDRVDEALRDGQLMIGWANAEGLLSPGLGRNEFRNIVHKAYYSDNPNRRKSGSASGHLWQFIHDMKKGDLVVVPSRAGYYLAEISDNEALFLRSKQLEDTSYRRNVQWLNPDEPISRDSLSAKLRAALAHARGTTTELSNHLDEITSLSAAADIEDLDWSPEELRLIVADYLEMLRAELAGRPYNKAQHRRALREQIKRSDGSIEFKHQNISAILEELNRPWIKGYKPRHNYQTALLELVNRSIYAELRSTRAIAAPKLPHDLAKVFVPPPPVGASRKPSKDEAARTPVKVDYAKRDEQNRQLGYSGEEFVFELEKRRLVGNPDALKRIRWVSRDEGDGAGYDIASVGPDGKDKYIEVKTTNGGIRTTFFLTETECAAAKRYGSKYRLYRVFNFGREPRIFEIPSPLEKHLELTPSIYLAAPM